MSFLKKFQYQIILCSLLFGLLALGLYLLRDSLAPISQKRESATTSVQANSQIDYKIFYTANGYSPATLKVPSSSRVAFVNSSKNIPLWTASDPHPAHTDYTQFDARKDYKPGQTYIFQFTKPGTFGFHNHEKSIDRGIIYVKDPVNPTEINKIKQYQRALRDKFLAMFKDKD